MDYLIGVDIGTQGTKAIMINNQGKIIAQSYKGYNVETPKPSWAEQWPDVWVNATYFTLQNVIEQSKVDPTKIKGVAISSLYGGSGIPVDEKVTPLAPCLIWMDRRAEEEVKWVKENIDLQELFQITGNFVDSYYGFTKMLWIKNNWPDVWRKINLFLPPNAFVIYQLTGEIAIDYSSAGNIGGIFDIKHRKWSTKMLEKMGIPLEYQPQKIISSTDIVGKITKQAAEKTGLKVGTPVIAGGVDAAVATLSAGALSEGDHVAMIGTSMCWGFITEKSNISKKLVTMPHVIDPLNKLYTFGGAATAGAIIRWFRDKLGEEELAVEKKLDINAYTLLEMKCKDIPAGSEGLLVLPYFMGERSPIWDSNARGTIIGLNLYHNKYHLYKAFMEGVAYALRHNMESVFNKDINLDGEVILVGGAAKSKIWPKIFADVTGFPVKIIKNDVEAPLGDALLAGVGTGVIKNPDILKEWLIYEDIIMPDRTNKEIYDEYYVQYKTAYMNLKSNMEVLSQLG
ncbi:FGGY-family carbohydrate kinase [Halothermothrix orenii]|uniref:L-fuculokinase n=1 Tax=Halothermothrix orenii (strain H 168 / OCM 544 / DSM 9562) TaxID=373903 RepID=B8CWP5_HALOH|nr:FGGY-family carbohydrate kinase [Halothermothrix orenii]ACL69714.1 L-fuculokinase [Halothermothrix orenii H 168]